LSTVTTKLRTTFSGTRNSSSFFAPSSGVSVLRRAASLSSRVGSAFSVAPDSGGMGFWIAGSAATGAGGGGGASRTTGGGGVLLRV
jgi:hypothetical protein